MDVLAGIDVGTTWVKAALTDADGRELAVERVRTPWREVPTGAECDPEDLFRAALSAVEAVAASPKTRIVSVGIASMAETGVLLDSAGRPAAPSIAWFDRRGRAESARIQDALG